MNAEQKLIKNIQSGNKEAFSLLVENLLLPAYRTAYIILRSKEYAEDAIQNALEDCYISIMRNKEIRNFKAWFYRIVYNRTIDIYRANKKNVTVDLEEHYDHTVDLKQSTILSIIKTENKSEMLKHIHNLPIDQSIPLLLHYYEDLSVKEVSLILNENINTVKTRLSRGRKKLGLLLQQKQSCDLEGELHV